MTYSEKLKDPRWQKKRLEIFQRDNFTCQKCDSTEYTLHVHHKIYEVDAKGFKKEPWEYDTKYLVTLCEFCHESEVQEMQQAIQVLTTDIKANFISSQIWELIVCFDFAYKEDISSKEIVKAINDSLRDLRFRRKQE